MLVDYGKIWIESALEIKQFARRRGHEATSPEVPGLVASNSTI